jgi:hypothetical protein
MSEQLIEARNIFNWNFQEILAKVILLFKGIPKISQK